ncbi:MAG: class I SAM-dependent methyltransferase [Balneolia bacterium]|nr:class I SAM-dependent methyltransferase [Balneolia bacterium]
MSSVMNAVPAAIQNKQEPLPRCPVSGSYDIRFIDEVTDFACSGETFQIWENKETGIRFTHPAPSPEKIGAYYEMEEYLSHDAETDTTLASVYRSARNFTLKWKFRLVKNRLPVASVRLLDFGAGTGEFAGFVKTQKPGWQVKAIETDEDASAQITGNYPGVTSYSDMNAFPKSEKFGAITAWHALEHVHDPASVLEQFHSRLFDYGIVVIALPNCSSYDAARYGNAWAGYDVPRHLFHFTPESFEALAASKGFEVVEKKRMLLDAFYVSLLSESYLGITGPGAAFKAGVAGTLSNLLSLVNVNRCSSVTYILRKNGSD